MHFQNNGAQQLASEATIFIVLEDVNDEIPLFTEREQETVMEGEPIGTPVTRWGEDFVSVQFLQFIFAHVDSKSEWKSNKILLTGSQLLHISSCAGMGISFRCKLYSNWWSMLYVLIFCYLLVSGQHYGSDLRLFGHDNDFLTLKAQTLRLTIWEMSLFSLFSI